MIEETPKRAPGYGSARFLIRGSNYLSLARARVLRPRYDEYPERVALDVGFPQPGRRGPSSAPKVTGGQGAGGSPAIAPISIYPAVRDRSTTPLASVGSVDGSGAGGVGCLDEGDTCISSPSLNAGASRVIPTNRIARPFVITHFQYWSEQTTPTQVLQIALVIKISDDNDTSGGLDTSGINIMQMGANIAAGGNILEPFNVVQTHYPNAIITDRGKLIKFAWRNNSGGALKCYAIVSIKFIG
jgi:hypothetical protein